jgi:cell wall assembly regulator SMI1
VSFVLGEVVHKLAVFFRRQAIWALVPLTLYVFAIVPFDTFRPTERSSRRPATPVVTEQQALSVRFETEQLLERLSARKHPHPEYEGTLRARSAPDEIAEIENYVGTRLPEDIRYFLERYDGLASGTSYRSVNWLTRREMLAYSRETADIHSEYGQAPQMIVGAWYHPAIVVFDDNGGGGLGVDPFSGIIYVWDHDGGQLAPVASSFRDLLRALDEQMAKGEEPYWRDLKTP